MTVRAGRRWQARLATSAMFLIASSAVIGVTPVVAASPAPAASRQLVANATTPYASDNFVRPAASGTSGSAPLGGA